MVYFAIAGVIIAAAIAGINILVNLPFVKHHVNKSKDVEAQPLLGDSGDFKRYVEEVGILPVVKKLWLEAIVRI